MKNSVELLGYYGSDEVIACSAWTSTSRDLTEDKKARVGKLIDMLWSHGHETPFEKGVVHFLVNTDIASHIHLLKHRITSLNAESARYKELKEDKLVVPADKATANKKVKVELEVDTSAKDLGPNPYARLIHLARAVDSWRIFPRVFITTYIILLYKCVIWYMNLEAPSMEQSGLISIVVCAGAAWCGRYTGSSI